MKKMYLVICGLITLTFFVACNKENGLENELFNDNRGTFNQTLNPYDSVGVLHNELIDFYKEHYQNNVSNKFFYYQSQSYLTQLAYDNILASIEDYMINTLDYNSSYIQSIMASIQAFNIDYGLAVTINGNQYVKILKDYHGAINYNYLQGRIDSTMFNMAMNIYTTTTPGYTCNLEQAISNIESAQIPTWSNSDIGNFLSLYRYSEALWESPIATLQDTTQPLTCGINPTQALAIADAAGLVLCSWMGPIGAAIGAAAATCAEAEDQENNISILCGSEYIESRYFNHRP